MTICPYCGQTHPSNAKFCPVTGQAIPSRANAVLVYVIGGTALGGATMILISVAFWWITNSPTLAKTQIAIAPTSTDSRTLLNPTVTAIFMPITTTPTLNPTVTPTLSPTSVPPPAVNSSTSPRVSNFYVCAQLCQENGANSTHTFAGGSKIIYARYNFENFPVGAKYTRRWTMNGNEWVRYNCAWQGPESGADTLKLTEPDGLHSGIWEISITLNDVTVFRETITVDGNWNYWYAAGTFNSCYGIR